MSNDLEIGKGLPVLSSRHAILFPGRRLPFKLKKKQIRSTISQANKTGGVLLFVGERPIDQEQEFYSVGTKAEYVVQKNEVLLTGLSRVHLHEFKKAQGVILANYSEAREDKEGSRESFRHLTKAIRTLGEDILSLIPADTEKFRSQLKVAKTAEELIYLVADHMESSIEEKQALLEEDSLKQRGLSLLERMQKAKEALEMQAQIRERLSIKMNKMQRDALLREHLRAIQEELGEGEQVDQLRNTVEDLPVAEPIKLQLRNELSKLEAMGRQSPEYYMIRNYLELVCQLPWESGESSEIDLETAQAILDQDHYGLSKVKKRILEHLAVMKLNKGHRGTILLFVGPPGVGKTSLGKSIAKALDRPFCRVSLGGVRDDAEIRGHRRTYIGAMPGQIIQSLKKVKKKNPVFLLDEVDKLGRGISGDPASALLEVLDPEQNSAFQDHYLDLPFDLSEILFICTANMLEAIPSPLRDRMEVIECSSYTEEEKKHIAKEYLFPRQLERHGLSSRQFGLRDQVFDVLIRDYTRESGVRELNRKIAALTRFGAKQFVEQHHKRKVSFNSKHLDEVFGPPLYPKEDADASLPVGVATGLAWTPVGGDILFIETKKLAGKGKLILTGQLGEVMKESAQIALSLLKVNLPSVTADIADLDIHIHVPTGAIPKDGPSAGIGLFSALVSLFTHTPIKGKIAFTGEITLRGSVMPVGGIKEKLLAAHRAGIQKVVLCKKNEKDLRDIPPMILGELEIVKVSTIDELLEKVLPFAPTKGPLLPGSAGKGYAALN